LQIDEGFLSAPSAVEYPTENGLTAFMNYYPPKNKVWFLFSCSAYDLEV
jgi:hypothetical protein